MMFSLSDVYGALKRISGYTRKTPLYLSPSLTSIYDLDVFLKLENYQVTGSFKVRGVFNKFLKNLELFQGEKIVTVSAGNHAIAVSYASRILGFDPIIIVPANVTNLKRRRIEAYGVRIHVYGRDYDEAETYAKELAEENNYFFVSPYNDIDIIEGNSTIALEVLEENPKIDIFIVPVGGGGLISGISFVAKKMSEKIRVIGVQSEASPAMFESVRRGRIVKIDLQPSIADGLHGNIEDNSITFDFVKKFVDEILLVSEEEIRDTIKLLFEVEGILIEGSAAVTIAALNRYKRKFRNKKVCLVLSGGNIDPQILVS